MDLTRTDRWSNTLTIDGVPLGRMDTWTGGDVKAATSTHSPGGMQPAIPVGAPAIPTQVTCTKFLDLDSDWIPICQALRSRVGKGQVVGVRQPLDNDGNPKGQPLVYSGILDNIHPGDSDSTKNDTQMWTLIFTPNGTVG